MKNEFVDEINDIMINKFSGIETEYISFDKTINPPDQGLYEDMFNSSNPIGLPPHKLKLKPKDASPSFCLGLQVILPRKRLFQLFSIFITGMMKGIKFYYDTRVVMAECGFGVNCLHGFLQSEEVNIFGYARTKLSDDELRDRIRWYLSHGNDRRIIKILATD